MWNAFRSPRWKEWKRFLILKLIVFTKRKRFCSGHQTHLHSPEQICADGSSFWGGHETSGERHQSRQDSHGYGKTERLFEALAAVNNSTEGRRRERVARNRAFNKRYWFASLIHSWRMRARISKTGNNLKLPWISKTMVNTKFIFVCTKRMRRLKVCRISFVSSQTTRLWRSWKGRMRNLEWNSRRPRLGPDCLWTSAEEDEERGLSWKWKYARHLPILECFLSTEFKN